MARGDWNQYGNADTDNEVSTNTAISEGTSLLQHDSSTAKIEIYGQSESDSPTDSRVVTYARADGSYSGWGAVFRFQDIDNYYICGAARNDGTLNVHIFAGKVIGGTYSTIGHTEVGGYWGSLNNTVSDGSSNIENTWIPWRFDSWVDSSGDLRFRVQEDADEDGTMEQYVDDFVDTSPDLGAGGGTGIGIIENNTFYSADAAYYDNVELWW